MSELTSEDIKNLLKSMQSANDPKDSFPMDGPVTAEQVAKYFSVTTKTIREWRKQQAGFPCPITFNERCTRYEASEVRGYWDSIVKKKAS